MYYVDSDVHISKLAARLNYLDSQNYNIFQVVPRNEFSVIVVYKDKT